MKFLFIILSITLCPCHAQVMAFERPSEEKHSCQMFKAVESTTPGLTTDPNKTKEKFELVINRITSLYSGTIKDLGANLNLDINWDSNESNAFALKIKTDWTLFFYGALYRNPSMTEDSMALTICHELGHLIGGAPFMAGTQMSVEGQADFWGASVCLKKYFSEFPETVKITDGTAKQRCDAEYQSDEKSKNICYRSANASMAMATFLSSMQQTAQPEFDKKNIGVLSTTKQLHPEAQCRLDTYMEGALCDLGDTGLSFEKKLLEEKLTTDFLCSKNIEGEITKSEQRPTCWFNQYNNSLFTFFKDKIKSKSLVGLKGGMISLVYYNNLPGDYVIRLVPDARSAFYVKVLTKDFKATLPGGSTSETIIFDYKFMKKADRKLKFKIFVEYNGKLIFDRDNTITVNAYSLVPN